MAFLFYLFCHLTTIISSHSMSKSLLSFAGRAGYQFEIIVIYKVYIALFSMAPDAYGYVRLSENNICIWCCGMVSTWTVADFATYLLQLGG
jgi:hypothetical protein